MLITLVLALILSQPVLPFLKAKLAGAGKSVQTAVQVLSYAGTLCLLFLCLLYLSAGTYSPFIYLNF